MVYRPVAWINTHPIPTTAGRNAAVRVLSAAAVHRCRRAWPVPSPAGRRGPPLSVVFSGRTLREVDFTLAAGYEHLVIWPEWEALPAPGYDMMRWSSTRRMPAC